MRVAKSIITILLITVFSKQLFAQKSYPADVTIALEQTKTNRAELEKVLDYFYKTYDTVKIKAVNFLIANMPIHASQNYYWADSNNIRLPFNDAAYEGFEKLVQAVENLKGKYGKIHPVPFAYRDVDSVKASMLINNIELAISSVKEKAAAFKTQPLFDKDFYEFILPYRTSIEPLENWRSIYANKFTNLINPKEAVETQLLQIGKNIKTWFTNTYAVENRGEPLPRLGAMQLLSRKKGACEDIAGLSVFMARSQGYAASVDFVPAWATSSGVHFLNYLNVPNNPKQHYDPADNNIVDTFPREPAKVLRTTYSIQPNTISAILHNDTSLIPMGFMRTQNYTDVTHEYWKTADISTTLFPQKNIQPSPVYLCAWNYLAWRPVWCTMQQNSSKATFTNMSKGAIYMPMHYQNQKLSAAGWPVINDFGGTQTLIPDTLHKRTVIIENQAKYLAFRTGSSYTLFYWVNKWVSVDTKKAESAFATLQFDNVPADVLLLLVPDYSQGKERVFVIDNKGKRKWY
jgi:Transglutaminase-like superfamily